jgi:predicted transcriptional regulator
MAKESITIRLRDELIDTLDDEANKKDVTRSEYIRQILQDRHEADELRDEMETLRERLESREARVTELEEQLTKRSRIQQKVDVLAQKEQESNAPFIVKWWRWYKDRD